MTEYEGLHDLEGVKRLSRDLRRAELSDREARYIVDAYYIVQDNRIAVDGQIRSMRRDGESTLLLDWMSEQFSTLEAQIRGALDRYSRSHPVGEWLRAQKGIGPVIAAGMLAHFDIEKAPTAGHFMAFAGLDPTREWGRGAKRPWNAALKTLCWKAGESFVKVSGDEDALYGRLYKARKEAETTANERGDYAQQAADALRRKNYGKTTEAYKHYSSGKLPPAHVHARAKRWAVKIFLSHLHEFWYEHHYGRPAPSPYPLAHLGHAHKICMDLKCLPRKSE